MRILIFNWKDLRHPAAGGAEVYTWEVARRLVAAGNEVCWFAGRARGLSPTGRYDGIEVVRAGGGLTVYRQARRFWQAEGGRFDLVVDEVNTRPFFTPQFVRRVPLVALIHQVCREVWFSELPWPVAVTGRLLLEPGWLVEYRHVPTLTVSPSSADSLRAYGLRLVADVGVGLSLPPRLPTLPKAVDPTVLFVGRMVANKRPHHVLESMKEVWRRIPQARLWMVGTGPLQTSLRRRALRLLTEAGLPADRIRFFGWVNQSEKFELMTRAWLLAVSSIREGWGMVVDEAAACGTPTVAYRVAGLCDSVPAAGGTLTDPDPQALGEALTVELHRRVTSAGRNVPGWWGGAVSWDEVAARFADGIRLGTGLPLSMAPLDALSSAVR